METLPLIVWDVDDVLNHLTYEWFEEYRLAHGLTLRYDELTANPPFEIMGIKREEFLSALDDFRRRRFAALEPHPETMAWFRAHGNRFRHVALSAVPMRCAPLSAEWVLRHYGKWIRGYQVVPSPRPDDDFQIYATTKGEVLAQFGPVDFMVDDSEANLATAAALPVRPVIFPAPWNRKFHEDPTVILEQNLVI